MDSPNRLLAALPPEEAEWLRPRLEPVALCPRQVLHWRAAPIEHAYFVEEGLVATLARTGEREEVEAWLIGREGLVGLPVLLGRATSVYRRVVQVGGRALRIDTGALRRTVEERPALRHHLLRYTYAVLVQTAQNGACAARHAVEQRLARWLLQARFSLGRDALPLTHALLAHLIGVRRASITVALGRLEVAGILRQERGCIIILDRERLELAACECYRVIRAPYDAIWDEAGRRHATGMG